MLEFEKSKPQRTFSILPEHGVLRKNEARLLVVRFKPTEKLLYDEGIVCYFNNSSSSKFELGMRGFGSYPSIEFGKDNSINFKPTCVGASSSRQLIAKNISKLSLNYEVYAS
jgi:hypothetical protein